MNEHNNSGPQQPDENASYDAQLPYAQSGQQPGAYQQSYQQYGYGQGDPDTGQPGSYQQSDPQQPSQQPGQQPTDQPAADQSYGQPQYGQSAYDQPAEGQPAEGQQPYQQSAYDQQAYGQVPYQDQYAQSGGQQGQPQYGQQGQPPYGQQYAQPQYDQQYGQQPAYGQQYAPYGSDVPPGYVPRQKLVAGLLGIFLGGLGIHNFYLGHTGKAIAQLLLSLVGWLVIVGPAISVIWSLVEGVLILCSNYGSPWHRDAHGVELRD